MADVDLQDKACNPIIKHIKKTYKNIFPGVAGAAVIAAAGVYLGVTTSAKSDPMTDLLMANVEALATPENPMDGQIYYVHASSSTSWTCTPPGSSACPRP
jgi:hypothetical protein